MIIHSFNGKTPQLGEGCFVAETAAVIGDVKMGKDCSVWYSAVVRGDDNSIEIGDRVSVQDCCCIHVTKGTGPVKIGSDVVIGHNATVHACTVGNHVLLGMGCTVLDGAVIGDGSIIAAGALVRAGDQVGPGEMWAGVPAKFVKEITPERRQMLVDEGVADYVELAAKYNEITK